MTAQSHEARAVFFCKSHALTLTPLRAIKDAVQMKRRYSMSGNKAVLDESKEDDVIIVEFRPGTTAERMKELVANQGCTLQLGFEGKMTTKIVVIKPHAPSVMIGKFLALPEVVHATRNKFAPMNQ